MKPVISWLRKLGYMSCIYLDDILVIGNSYDSCAENTHVTCKLLESLGFIINTYKSHLIPSTRQKFLGLNYDSEKVRVELPTDKVVKIKKLIDKFRITRECRIREFARFVGSLEVCCPALKYGRVHMRSLERERFLAFSCNNDNFEAYMTLSDTLKVELEWWKRNINLAHNSIMDVEPDIEMFTDASLSGWGAFCNGTRANDYWNKHEQKWDINRLELKAALFGLKCFAKKS